MMDQPMPTSLRLLIALLVSMLPLLADSFAPLPAARKPPVRAARPAAPGSTGAARTPSLKPGTTRPRTTKPGAKSKPTNNVKQSNSKPTAHARVKNGAVARALSGRK
jgi:hypothetical protein